MWAEEYPNDYDDGYAFMAGPSMHDYFPAQPTSWDQQGGMYQPNWGSVPPHTVPTQQRGPPGQYTTGADSQEFNSATNVFNGGVAFMAAPKPPGRAESANLNPRDQARQALLAAGLDPTLVPSPEKATGPPVRPAPGSIDAKTSAAAKSLGLADLQQTDINIGGSGFGLDENLAANALEQGILWSGGPFSPPELREDRSVAMPYVPRTSRQPWLQAAVDTVHMLPALQEVLYWVMLFIPLVLNLITAGGQLLGQSLYHLCVVNPALRPVRGVSAKILLFILIWLCCCLAPSLGHPPDEEESELRGSFSAFELLGTVASPLMALLSRSTPNQAATTPVQQEFSHMQPFFVDSCCFRTLTGPSPYVHDIQDLPRMFQISGYTGAARTFTKGCTLKIPVSTDNDTVYELIIKDCLYDPNEQHSLISHRDLKALGFQILDSLKPKIFPQSEPSQLPTIHLQESQGLPTLPVACTGSYDGLAFVANCGAMTLEEVMHLRLGHLPLQRLVRSSRQVSGVPRILKDASLLRLPCGICQEAKAKRQNFPSVSTSHVGRETKMICWDMFSVSEFPTWGGNKYCSLFLCVDSHFIIAMLHEDKKATTVINMLRKVFNRAGYIPKVVRMDNAGEYIATDTAAFLERCEVQVEEGHSDEIVEGHYCDVHHSNPGEQFQNGKAEHLVHVVSSGVRTLLLQSGLPAQAWGAALLYYVDILNNVSSSAIQNRIPFEVHTGRKADWSWFRPFGCRATIWLGRDAVQHSKISPRGETGIFLGLGFQHNRKGWLVYRPSNRRIDITRNCTFDETLFPLLPTNQRVFGHYDNQRLQELKAEATPSIGVTPLAEVLNMKELPSSSTVKDLSARLMHSYLEDLPSTEEGSNSMSDFLSTTMYAEDLESHVGATAAPATLETSSSSVSGGSPVMSSSGGGESRPTRSEADKTEFAAGSTGTSSSGSQNIKKRKEPASSAILNWWDVQYDDINETSDEHLANFLIGHSVKLRLPKDFYPEDGGHYWGEAIDTVTDAATKRTYKNQTVLAITLCEGPKPVQKDGEHEQVHIPMSKFVRGVDISVRRVIKEQFPNAKQCTDLTIPTISSSSAKDAEAKKIVHDTRSRRRAVRLNEANKALFSGPAARSDQGLTQNLANKIGLKPANLASKIGLKPKSLLAGLFCLKASLMLDQSQSEHDFRSVFLPAEPKSQRDARLRPDAEEWICSEWKEIKTVWDMGTFEVCECPEGVVPLPMMFCYKLKSKPSPCGTFEELTRKARIVVRGDLQTSAEYSTTFAPTARFTAIRTVLSIAAQENLKLKSWDIQGAFCSSEIDNDNIFVSLPPGYSLPHGKVLRLKKSLYGLRQSPGLFHDSLEQWLTDYGFRAIDPEGTLFRLDRPDGYIILSLFVDDGLCAFSSDSVYAKFLEDLSKKYKLSDQGDLHYYLGANIKQDLKQGTVKITQSTYINTLLDRFQMADVNAVDTPMITHQHLTKEDCPDVPDKQAVKHYQQLVGGLLYCSNFSRVDIAHAVNQCAKFMTNCGPSHIAAAKRILAYLKTTKDMGLTFRRSNSKGNTLSGYADADHAGDPDGRRSVTGYALLLNGAAITWQSVRQHVVSLSSAEAEYYAASTAGTDVQYCRRLLAELGFAQSEPTQIGEDNMACIYMSTSSAMYNRVKHIDIRVYHLRSLCQEGVLKLYKVASQFQVADSLTKSTPFQLFRAHRSVLLGG